MVYSDRAVSMKLGSLLLASGAIIGARVALTPVEITEIWLAIEGLEKLFGNFCAHRRPRFKHSILNFEHTHMFFSDARPTF